jgi:hypothetical protein
MSAITVIGLFSEIILACLAPALNLYSATLIFVPVCAFCPSSADLTRDLEHKAKVLLTDVTAPTKSRGAPNRCAHSLARSAAASRRTYSRLHPATQ